MSREGRAQTHPQRTRHPSYGIHPPHPIHPIHPGGQLEESKNKTKPHFYTAHAYLGLIVIIVASPNHPSYQIPFPSPSLIEASFLPIITNQQALLHLTHPRRGKRNNVYFTVRTGSLTLAFIYTTLHIRLEQLDQKSNDYRSSSYRVRNDFLHREKSKSNQSNARSPAQPSSARRAPPTYPSNTCQ